MVQPLWKTAWKFLKKLKIELPYDAVIPFLGIYPKELKTGSQRGGTLMFFQALLIIAKIQEQCKCVHLHWMCKGNVVYSHNGTLFIHEIEGNPTICNHMDDLEDFMLNGISQSQKDTWCMISLIWAIHNSQTLTSRVVVSSGWGGGRELLFHRHKVSVTQGELTLGVYHTTA